MRRLHTRTNPVESATTTAVSAIWIVFGIASLSALATGFTIITGRSLVLFGDGDGRLPLEYLPQLIQAEPFLGEAAWLTDSPLWLRILCSLGTFVSLGIFILAASKLHKVIKGLALNKPFSQPVLKNWKALSLVLILGGVLQGLAETAAFGGVYYVTTTPDPNLIWGSPVQILTVHLPQWPWWTLLMGIVTEAIFVAFKSGAELEKDVVGLV